VLVAVLTALMALLTLLRVDNWHQHIAQNMFKLNAYARNILKFVCLP
jgi:hypothetical protein